MADSQQIIAVLEALGNAYPRQPISKQTAELYMRFLTDIPGDLLWQVAEHYITTSSYFPRIAELRTLATRLAGTSKFNSLAAPTSSPDTLAYQAQALEDEFYQDRILDPEAWLALAEEFDRLDRPYRADYTRRKLTALQSILEQEAKRLSPSFDCAQDGRDEIPEPTPRDEVEGTGERAGACTVRSRSGDGQLPSPSFDYAQDGRGIEVRHDPQPQPILR